MLAHVRPSRFTVFLLALALLCVPAAAQAQTSGDAVLELLRVLRDHNMLTADEYDALRGRVAATSTSTPTPAPSVDDTVKRALTGKWYERIGVKGYAQLRMTNTFAGDGVAVEVPSDRSVNDNETLMLRRGRLVLAGDITDHLALYAQTDFNASSNGGDSSLQMRDLYADIALDKARTFRVRVGQSKVPYGFINMQSSQNRAALERPDAINSAVEGERDLSAYLMWAPARTRTLFKELVTRGLKGSGDYGVIAVGALSGQGMNRPDQNGSLHWLGRASYPFALHNRQIVELAINGYTGKFVTTTQSVTIDGTTITPSRPADGQADDRVGVTAVLYPQPFGIEAEWNVGRGPELASDFRRIETARLNGGYVQLSYRTAGHLGTWFPFTRWQYFDGARKFAKNAPRSRVNEVDFGLEFAKWSEVEVTGMFTHTFERVRTSAAPYLTTRQANRLAVQVQWNY